MSAEPEFTRGDWQIDDDIKDRLYVYVVNDEGVCLAQVHRRPNAHLIAAAPGLFNALAAMTKRYVELVSSGDCGFWNANEEDCVKAAHAALSKAIGGTP